MGVEGAVVCGKSALFHAICISNCKFSKFYYELSKSIHVIMQFF